MTPTINSIYKIMVLHFPEIPPKGGLGKTTLSLSKDVTIRLGWGGIKGKSDDVTLYDVFFRRET